MYWCGGGGVASEESCMWSGLDYRIALVRVFMHTRKHRHANHTRTHGDVKKARKQAVTPHDLVSFIHSFTTYFHSLEAKVIFMQSFKTHM